MSKPRQRALSISEVEVLIASTKRLTKEINDMCDETQEYFAQRYEERKHPDEK